MITAASPDANVRPADTPPSGVKLRDSRIDLKRPSAAHAAWMRSQVPSEEPFSTRMTSKS
jgi:hypothetical protein